MGNRRITFYGIGAKNSMWILLIVVDSCISSKSFIWSRNQTNKSSYCCKLCIPYQKNDIWNYKCACNHCVRAPVNMFITVIQQKNSYWSWISYRWPFKNQIIFKYHTFCVLTGWFSQAKSHQYEKGTKKVKRKANVWELRKLRNRLTVIIHLLKQLIENHFS